MEAWIVTQRAIEEVISVDSGGVNIGKQEPAALVADGLQGFLGIARGHRFVTELRDHRRESVQLGRVIVQHAGCERTFRCDNLDGLGERVGHGQTKGKKGSTLVKATSAWRLGRCQLLRH